MFATSFTPEQLLLILSSVTLIFLGIISFQFQKNKNTAICLLLLGSAGIRIFMALLDPFLNMWDEQIHAQVAKNMMSDPFKPMLYADPALPFDFTNWAGNQVWLHKQPLFLWQIALFFKFFGVSEFTLRMPSVIMMSVLVFFIYRIGKLIANEKTGFYGALLISLNYFFLDLTSGVKATDHNDIAFLFYVTASIWAWTEYELGNNKYSKLWIVLIGVFSGMAILNKWLTGLLVFAGWLMTLIGSRSKRNDPKRWKHFLLSLSTCVIVFLPWQLYILVQFPQESRHEYALNALHFFNVVEGHEGGTWYHFYNIGIIYGKIVPYIIIPAIYFLAKSAINKLFTFAFILLAVGIYIFFTLAQTKMPCFTIIASPVIFLSLGSFIAKAFDYIQKLGTQQYIKFIFILLLGLISFINFDISTIETRHAGSKRDVELYKYRKNIIINTAFYKGLKDSLPPGKYAIFNCNPDENISVMFYTGFSSYSFIPTKEELKELKEKNIKIIALDNQNLPDYLKNDNDISIILYPQYKAINQKDVFLKASNGKFISPDIEKNIVANSEQEGNDEKFILISYFDGKIALQDYSGNYICAEINSDKRLVANRATAEYWEKFSLVELGGNKFALKAENDLYIKADPTNNMALFAISKSIGTEETFEMIEIKY